MTAGMSTTEHLTTPATFDARAWLADLLAGFAALHEQ
jgi:hypothetical protein